MYQEQNVALSQQEKFRPINNWVLAMEHLDLVYINYSIGNDIGLCYNEYVTAAGYYGEGWDADAFYKTERTTHPSFLRGLDVSD